MERTKLKTIEQLAADGKTNEEIALALGVSRSTFLRSKRTDAKVKAAYQTGLARWTRRSGKKVEVKGNGVQYVTGVANPVKLVLDHLMRKQTALSFDSIRRALKLKESELSEALAVLVNVRRHVKPFRHKSDGEFRYYATYTGNNIATHQFPKTETKPRNAKEQTEGNEGNTAKQNARSNGSPSAGFPTGETRWQAAY